MSLMNLLAGAGGGDGLSALGGALGVAPETVEALAGQIAPAIAGGMRRRASAEGGLGAVLGALKGEDDATYYDDAAAAVGPAAQARGADFLTGVFGDSQAAPRLAHAAAERTGAPVEAAEKMVPALAAMLRGGMQRQAPDAEIDGMMQGIAASGGDKAGAGLGDLLGAIGGGSGGALGGLLGAVGGSGGGLGGLMGALGGGGGAASGGGLAPLLQMLDADGDGSPLDDVLGMIMK